MPFPLPPPNLFRDLTGSDSINGQFFFAAGVETDDSLMPGAGDGLFTTVDFKSGGLLFSLRQPLLLIANGTKGNDCKAPLELLAKTCDRCFSSFDTEHQASATTIGEDLVLVPCERCGVLYYCDMDFRNCRGEDPEHHHIYECSTLKRIRRHWRWPIGNTVDKKRLPVEDECLRGAVRLLCSRKRGEVSDAEIAAFLGISRIPSVSGNNFEDICKSIFTHRLIMAHPTIGSTSSDFSESYTKTGFCFNTFAAKLNHSCTPNVIFFFDKFELQCRAARNIKAGEELTIAYDAYGYDSLRTKEKPGKNHYQTFWDGNYLHRRRQDLHSHYGFWCACDSCMARKLGPDTGDIDFSSSGIGLYENHEVYEKLQLVERLVKAKGFKLTSFPMKDTYDELIAQSARFVYTNSQGGQEFRAILSRLKACLTLYFLVEPGYEVSIPLDNRCFTLRKLTLVLRLAIEVDPARKEMYTTALAGFQTKLYKSVQKCYGYDTQIGEEEFSLYESEAVWNEDKLKTKFDRHLRELLRWAGFTDIQIERADKSISALS
ncbi:hypothetical protein VTL71DRAFT_432 [Oculimacula yallundae]|uniref:SET domain-containing protein n=1 Tax=Oculimacula yallundae TaxID=86028 RepID=A0ABR4D035_9HELO